MNSPENTIDRRSTDYKNRLRSACSGLRTPVDRRKRPTAHLIDILTEETAMSPTPPEPEMTVETALARLRQYQERPAKTWSTATYTSGDEQALAAIAHTLAEAVKSTRSTRSDRSLVPNDTLGAWLYRRFSKSISPAWVALPDEEKDYWEHEADAVRRAVARGGFKNTDADHRPTLVHFGNRHSAPAEVCWGCSDEDAGRWVPVTQCTTARAQMTEGPGSLYASSVVIPHPEGE